MATREDQLVREIEQIRGDLAENLEAIGDRVAPKKVMNRAKAKAADKIEALGEKVSPRRLLERQTEGLRDRLQSIQESFPSRGGDDGDRELSERSGGTRVVPTHGRPLGQRPARTPRTVAEQVESVQADEERPGTGSLGRPVAAGLVVAGAGLLIARLMRPGGPERRAARRVKEKLDPRQEEAVGRGQPVAGELPPPAAPAATATPSAKKATTSARKTTPSAAKPPRTAARQVAAGAGGAAKQVKAQGARAPRGVKAPPPAKTTKASGASKARPSGRVAP